MPKIFIYAFAAAIITIGSCSRDNDSFSDAAPGLNGSWKMTKVYDKGPDTFAIPSASATRNVVITFDHGRFSANTIVNHYSNGIYKIQNDTTILFESFASTKVAEDTWGGSFGTMLMSCGLQSSFPCRNPAFRLNGNTLTITTVLRYDYTFEKL
ncbi:MAG: hypothetical protein H7Y27_00100 [Gemmatimonadaceae bacterium]|nr:hypothetical protein [Chitinophagaceae bacterium]